MPKSGNDSPDAFRSLTDPAISVIIPVYNAAAHLRQCLKALSRSTISFECIVVDDGSLDGSPSIAADIGATVISTGGRRGPAFARNAGAGMAKSALLLFLDSDVCVEPDSLARVVALFSADPDLAAAFGSYDDTPAQQDFLSQYRNLMHHFIHQHSQTTAHTFWSGFGAIRAAVFRAHGGFDTRFSRPAIEDIELGHRLHQSGCRIVLDPSLQVKHLKAWTFWAMVTTDVRDRAMPWTELIIRESEMPRDLNLGLSQRISVALAFLIIGIAIISSAVNARLFIAPLVALLFLMCAHYEVELTTAKRFKGTAVTIILLVLVGATSLWSGQTTILVVSVLVFLLLLLRRHYYSPAFPRRRTAARAAGAVLVASVLFVAAQPGSHLLNILFLISGGLLILLNARFYALLASKRGRTYALAAIPFHVLFFLYSGIAFIAALCRHYLHRIGSPFRAAQADCRRSGTAG